MRFAARTHAGKRGGQNEDAMGWDESQSLWFVADGMGGHASGDVASRVVSDALLAAGSMPLVDALVGAHAAVVSAAAANPEHHNMGSTAVTVRFNTGGAEIAWVGDSRAYLWSGRRLSAVTRDHSFLELLRERQNLSDAQLRAHPDRHLVTQTLGIGTPEPSVKSVALRRNDWLLLCSDGLNDELDDAEIGSILQAHSTPDAAADALIDATLAHGGRDNVSVVLVEYDGPDGASTASSLSSVLVPWLPALAGLTAFLAAVLWWQSRSG